MTKKKLRIDIEALRGLSVILVILYHFKFTNLDYQIIKGGFIGVDIFFVISGFFALPDLIAFFSGDPTAPLPVIILGLITFGLFYYGSKKGTI